MWQLLMNMVFNLRNISHLTIKLFSKCLIDKVKNICKKYYFCACMPFYCTIIFNIEYFLWLLKFTLRLCKFIVYKIILQVVERNSELFSALVIKKVSLEHCGTYTCVASNHVAKVNRSTELYIKGNNLFFYNLTCSSLTSLRFIEWLE